MTDGGGVRSFRSGLFAQRIGIVTDGFGHDADRHCIGVKGFRPCA